MTKTINEAAKRDRLEEYDKIKCPDGQIIDMRKLLDDQSRAKVALTNLVPWFRGFIGELKFVYTFKVNTQATDGVYLYVNPQFTYNLSMEEKCFVMAHEIMHCLLNHMRRGESHNPDRSNIAADYECNITLADMGLFSIGMQKKIGAYVDKKYSGWGYEKIYDNVTSSGNNGSMSNSGNGPKSQGSQGSQGSGGGQGGGQKSADWKAGWKQAIEDYNNGKLKL